jgi:DNA-binding HxlR family transcriptional regulator
MTQDDPDGEAPIPGTYDGGHPATGLFSLLGRSHAMAILFYVVREEPRPWRFSELEETLDISPNTLSNRLAELVEAGLLERRSYDEIPPRVEYEATRRALDLAPVFEALREWAEEHGEATGLVETGPE